MVPVLSTFTDLWSCARWFARPAAVGLLLAGCALPSAPPAPPIPATLSQSDAAFTMADGAVLPARVWRPDGGTPPHLAILALHGMNDSRDAWELPAPAVARAGAIVYAPDQRGFGGAPRRGYWPGTEQLVGDAAAMLDQVRQRHPGLRVVLMGESMGGAVGMVLLSRPALPQPDAAVLFAPAVWGRADVGVVLHTGLWVAATMAPGLHVTGREVNVTVQASDNRDALIRLATDPLTLRRTRFDALRGLTEVMDAAQRAAPTVGGPVLVLYGARDELVPAAATARTWRALNPSARRGYYAAGYHLLTRDRGRDLVIGDVVAWLDDPGGWLPSGADIRAATFLSGR